MSTPTITPGAPTELWHALQDHTRDTLAMLADYATSYPDETLHALCAAVRESLRAERAYLDRLFAELQAYRDRASFNSNVRRGAHLDFCTQFDCADLELAPDVEAAYLTLNDSWLDPNDPPDHCHPVLVTLLHSEGNPYVDGGRFDWDAGRWMLHSGEPLRDGEVVAWLPMPGTQSAEVFAGDSVGDACARLDRSWLKAGDLPPASDGIPSDVLVSALIGSEPFTGLGFHSESNGWRRSGTEEPIDAVGWLPLPLPFDDGILLITADRPVSN